MTHPSEVFRFRDFRQMPEKCGVYCVYCENIPLYVGMTGGLKSRWSSPHERFVDFVELGADTIVVIYCEDYKKAMEIETEMHGVLCPVMQSTNLTRAQRLNNEKAAMQSKLYQITHIKLMAYINGRPLSRVARELEADTSLSASWITSFALNRCGNPAVNKVEELYEFLSGHKLELR